MKLTPNNFLQLIKNLVTGGGLASVNVNGTTTNQLSTIMPADAGFFVDIEYPVNSLIQPASGTTLATAFTNGKAIKWTAANTNSVVIPFIIPRDYDQSFDWIDLTLVGAKAGAGSDTPKFTVQAFVLPMNASATNSAMNPNASVFNINVPVVTFTQSTAIAHFNFQGNGLQRKQIINFVVTPSGNATGGQELLLADASITYASCLVAFQEDSLGNDPVDLAANDEIGVPLR